MNDDSDEDSSHGDPKEDAQSSSKRQHNRGCSKCFPTEHSGMFCIRTNLYAASTIFKSAVENRNVHYDTSLAFLFGL